LNFSCDNCQRRYSIADEKVRGKTVKVRCKNCQNVISVQGPPMEVEESTRVVSLADVERIREQERAMAAAASAPAAEAPAGASPWEDEPTRAAPARPAAAPWFVMVKSKQEGPLDEAGLQALMESGAVNARSFFWQQGMADWKRGSDIPELSGLFAAPPPPPALPPEPSTVAMRGPRNAPAASQAQPEPQQEDNSWDDVPTTVGQAPAAREPWDLDPPAAAQQRQHAQQQAAWDEPAQQDQAAWDEQGDAAYGQQDQPAWDDQGAQAQGQEDQPAWDEQGAQDPGQEDQPAWDEPAQQEQPSASARSGAAANKAGVGDDLFSDLDLPDRNEPPDDLESQLAAQAENTDPLASVRGSKADKKPVEDTRYFMKKSGVTRRNPAWKVALFITLPILLIVGGAFALDRLNFVPKVKVVNAQGQTEEKSLLFSGEGHSELKDLLLGNKKTPPPAPAPAAPEKKAQPGGLAPKPDGAAEEKPSVPETGKSSEELQQLYGDASKTDVGPAVRKDTEVAAKDAAGSGGPPPADVMKVVEKSQGAFQGCVETELRKNPKFKGGKVLLVATVGTSGTVKSTKLDRKELDSSPVGDCIKKSAKRMVFPAFKLEDGSEDVELQIPLVLTAGAM
jgi:predicted Zn finger-like uncharacterized protein